MWGKIFGVLRRAEDARGDPGYVYNGTHHYHCIVTYLHPISYDHAQLDSCIQAFKIPHRYSGIQLRALRRGQGQDIQNG